MAKSKSEEEAQSLAVTVAPGELSPEMAQEYAEFAGAGLSERSEDFLLPFLYIAQSGSPQVKKQRTDKYIPGLEVGDIFNTATGQFWRGDTGLVVLHAWFQKAEVEWLPRSDGGGDGAGYVATHPFDTPLKNDLTIGERGERIIRPGRHGASGGHLLAETAYHFVIDAETCEPAVVAMGSTGLQVSRQWLTMMRQFKIPTPQGPVTAPTFARLTKIKTAWRQNDQGDWFVFKAEDMGWAGRGYERARMVAKDFFLQAREHGVKLGRPPAATESDAGTTVDDNVPI